MRPTPESDNLNGATGCAKTALLLIDVINDLEFDGGEELLNYARPMASSLEILLRYLGTTTLVLTGMAGDYCVLFTANDAHMRDFRIIVPSDCVASEDAERNREALALMQRVLNADLTPSGELKFNQSGELLTTRNF